MSSLFALTPPLKVAPFSLSLPPSTKGPYTIFLQKHSSFNARIMANLLFRRVTSLEPFYHPFEGNYMR